MKFNGKLSLVLESLSLLLHSVPSHLGFLCNLDRKRSPSSASVSSLSLGAHKVSPHFPRRRSQSSAEISVVGASLTSGESRRRRCRSSAQDMTKAPSSVRLCSSLCLPRQLSDHDDGAERRSDESSRPIWQSTPLSLSHSSLLRQY